MTNDVVDPRSLRRKLAWRIVPLIFLMYVVAYLDRANIAFAKLQMQERLGFDNEVFGWGMGTCFFAGYLLLEIPGALLVEHWSARKWFARILITWGVCSTAMALVRTPMQFYLARFLLGLAEAGFFPGIIVYFTHWFPRADRGRAMAGMVLGIPLSLALGSVVSGWLMQHNWLGVAGWQWMFVFEGFPAVLLGLAVPFIMTDRPRQAKWLDPAERVWLENALESERKQAVAKGAATLRQALRQPAVWLLAAGIFATNTGGYGLGFWLPTVVKDHLVESQDVEKTPESKQAALAKISDAETLRWTGGIYVCGLFGVWLSGRSTDRTGERKWHCVAGQVLTGVFLAASVIPGQPWGMIFVWLCLLGFFAYFWPPPFWVLPTMTMSASAAAVAIGFINICANVAGMLGPLVLGLQDKVGLKQPVCLAILAGCYVLGGVIVSLLRVQKQQ